MPGQLIPNHRVEKAQQLAHAGYDLDLLGLAKSVQTVGKGFDDRIATDGGDCGHVQDGAN